MKRLPILILVALAIGWLAHAAQLTIIGSLATVNGTAYSSTNVIQTIYPARGTFLIQNAGLSGTGALTGNVQVSIDGTNFLTVATYGPTSTNATTDTFIPSYSPVSLYMRLQVVTTNSVQVGAFYSQ